MGRSAEPSPGGRRLDAVGGPAPAGPLTPATGLECLVYFAVIDSQTNLYAKWTIDRQPHAHTQTSHTQPNKQTTVLLKPDQQHYRAGGHSSVGRGPPADLRYNYVRIRVSPPPPRCHIWRGLLFAAPRHSSHLTAGFTGSAFNA